MGKGARRSAVRAATVSEGPLQRAAIQKIPDFVIVLCIFAVAFTMRAIYFRQIHNSPPFAILSLDDSYYDTWALQISKGDLLGKEVFYGLPLYPYLLGLIYSIFGHSIFIARLAHALFDSISCVLLFALGKRIFDRATAILASCILASYGMSFYISGFLSSGSLSMLLNLSLLLALLSLYRNPTLTRWLAAGVLIGIISLANASVLLFAPCVIAWACVAFKDRGGIRRAVGAVAMVAAIASVISITAVRNFIVGKDFVPVTAHSGITFYAGNNPESIGAFNLPQQLRGDVLKTKVASRTIAEKALGRTLKPSEVSKFWFDRAFDFIRRSPLAYAALIVKKIYFFWWVREIPEEVPLSVVKNYSSILRLPLFSFAVVSPLSIIGLVLAYRKERKDLHLLYLFVGASLVSTALYFVNSRYRIITEPVLILFASFTIVRSYQKIREGRYPYAASVLIASILLFLFFNINVASYRQDVVYGKLGVSYASQGLTAQAEEAFKKAIAFRSSNPISHYNLGTFYMSQKRYKEAIERFKEALRLDPGYADAHNNIGTIYLILGRKDLALRHFEQSLQTNPYQENIRKAVEDTRKR